MGQNRETQISTTMMAVWIIFAASGAVAGDPQTDSRSSFKIQGRPGDRCANFLVSEVGVNYGDKGGDHLNADLGFMHNDKSNNALGISLWAYIQNINEGHGNGFGIRPRYKRWFSGKWSMDLSVGIVFPDEDRGSLIMPMLSLSFAEIVSLDLSVEKRFGEYAHTETFLGITLRSYAGMAAMVAGPVLMAL